ncbi:MAG: chorismate mutase [Microcystis wesenbergii Mw_MB_S_20031200_S109]|uniref:chorismate mutase n=1 Tax=Microcystis wesenbergii Mw_MB_S_20031200_S109D TaxID=2486241 RepID=A0A552MAX3_9CHRO|nr:MAG: chorismate mutase [Microcystis wesenbergii Mw_MB_S_20031200_S109]TRV29609.1 MAG: chorismate mutase [Microcystis wesenbergii Mw_MB_S_20031200_S109D]
MTIVQWKVRAIRGATTVTANTIEAIREAVTELLEAIEIHNSLDPDDIVSVIFTATQDLDAIFPAAIARERPHWQNVPLLDVQQMHVAGSLDKCIRVILHVNTPKLQSEMQHVYLRGAKNLRPDWQISPVTINR